MTPIPIIVPARAPHCPKCDRVENTKLVCRHCGFEYEDDGGRIWPWLLLVLLGAAVGIWAFVTVVEWIDPYKGNPTLVEVIQAQWAWVRKLRLW